MPVLCPKCKENMELINIKGCEIDYCQKFCQGIWLDDGEAKYLKQKGKWNWTFMKVLHRYKRRPISEILDEEKRVCPRCNDILEQVELPPGSELYLDTCYNCKGLFFDKGELKKYIHWLKEQEKFEELKFLDTYKPENGNCESFMDVISMLCNISRLL